MSMTPTPETDNYPSRWQEAMREAWLILDNFESDAADEWQNKWADIALFKSHQPERTYPEQRIMSMTTEETIASFQRRIFDAENNPRTDDLTCLNVQLDTLAIVARKLYAYEKFISELQETLKDGDEKRRIIAQKIEEL